MSDTAGRLLALLGLLQSRAEWKGHELAERLGVTPRTLRTDIGRLRELGYPLEATRGPHGAYRLGAGAQLPPLLLDDGEAVAVAVGLRSATVTPGIEETSARALAKLEQVLPHRLRRKVGAVLDATSHGPENTTSNAEDPPVDADLLAAVAAAARDHEEIRFYYRDEPHLVEPYRVVSWERRWYIVGRDPASGTWAPYRLDWMTLRTPGGKRFSPVDFEEGDHTSFVVREIAYAGWNVHAQIVVHASADDVLARINPAVGVVEQVSEDRCVLVTGADSIETVAVYIGMLGLDFTVEGQPELAGQLELLSHRYARAVTGDDPRA